MVTIEIDETETIKVVKKKEKKGGSDVGGLIVLYLGLAYLTKGLQGTGSGGGPGGGPPPPPAALAVASFSVPNVMQLQTFTPMTAQAKGGVPPYSYKWVFSDGGNAFGPSVSYAFQAAGSYTVTCYMSDSTNATVFASIAVNVVSSSGGGGTPPPPPPSPLAAQANIPGTWCLGQVATFSASASGGTAPYSFQWQFGDGSSAIGANVTHSYSQPGNYTVTVTANDSANANFGIVGSITINNCPSGGGGGSGVPVTISTLTVPGTAPIAIPVQMSVVVTGGLPPYNITWSFGDGGFGFGPVVANSYLQPGNYTIQVTVQDAAFNNTSKTTSITIFALI